MSQITLKAKVVRELYYNGDFGVYAFQPLQEINQETIELNTFGNFTVNGQTFRLNENMDYEITVEPSWSKKYGDGFKFISVKQDRPSTVDEQQKYIRMVLTEREAEAIINKYPNDKIIDLMQNGKFDYADIKGIGDYTYNIIYKRIIENLEIQEALVQLGDMDLDFKKLKKLIAHFGSPQLVVQKVKSDIYSLCKVKGFGFKTVDKWALNRGDSKEDKKRILAGFDYIIAAEESEGHCYMTIFSAIEKARELLEVNRQLIEEVIFETAEKDFHITGDIIARKRTYEAELNIAKKLKELQNAQPILKVKYDLEKLKEVEKEQGFEFTDEQKTAIKMAVENNVLILNGKGGVGKTATLKGILALCSDYNHVACALSGKASKVLAKNGLKAKTIHRLLSGQDGHFSHNEDNPLTEHIVVLDETSMVNVFLFNSLVSAIRKGYKLIIVGDSGQLASIGCGAVFRDLVDSDTLPKIELTKVQRQAQKSGILSVANQVREGKLIIPANDFGTKVHGELKDFTTISLDNKEEMLDIVCSIVQKKFVNTPLYDFQIITGRKKDALVSAYNLNLEIQQILNPCKGNSIYKNGYNFYVGDKVIQVGNNYGANTQLNSREDDDFFNPYGSTDVFNGTIGIIKDIHLNEVDQDTGTKETKIFIDFEDEEETVVYNTDDMEMLELAYAISCHRSQGSTIKYVLFTFDYSAYKLLSRQFVYTGISRASKGGLMLTELSALRYGIKQDASDTRRTFLKELL